MRRDTKTDIYTEYAGFGVDSNGELTKITGCCEKQEDAAEWAAETVNAFPEKYSSYIIRNRTVVHTKEMWHE